MSRTAGTSRATQPIPPGKREYGERWSASGVRLRITGRSRLSGRIHHALGRVALTATALFFAVGLASRTPLPTKPVALGCTEDTRWTDACRTAGPEPLADAVAPPELARRLAANWDFAPDNGLWRAGSPSWHVAQRAQALKDDARTPEQRGAAAASLASVLQAPQSYGNWTTADDADLAQAADDIAALYDARADEAWLAHQAQVRTDWNDRAATVQTWRAAAGSVLPFAGGVWLFAMVLFATLRGARTLAERPVHVHLDPHTLRLDDLSIPMAALDSMEFRWGRIELGLRDGTRWISRPLSPRNPARLELMVMRRRHPKTALASEGVAREKLHSAMRNVLQRVGT